MTAPIPDHDVTPLEYFLYLLSEECGEILQCVGKGGRFGMDTPGVKNPLTGHLDLTVTPRSQLEKELGDLVAAIDYGDKRGIISAVAVFQYAACKLTKLLDAEARDNLGRRLAP